MSDELLAYGHRKMKEYAHRRRRRREHAGLLTMTDARWHATVDFLRSRGPREARRRLPQA